MSPEVGSWTHACGPRIRSGRRDNYDKDESKSCLPCHPTFLLVLRKRCCGWRRFQFSLSTLLLVTTVVSVLMSWVAVKRREAARENLAAEQLEREAHASIAHEPFYEPGWWARLLGRGSPPVVDISLDVNSHELMDEVPERIGALGRFPVPRRTIPGRRSF